MPAVNWTVPYLRALGMKPTPEAQARLQQWQRWEGGSTDNAARNNYMNSKQSMPGSWDAIGNGVQGYKTLAQGAQAFARTLNAMPEYSPLKQWIASGQGNPVHALGVWVAGPGGAGSPSALAYAQKVLGTAGAPPSAAVTPQVAPGAPPAPVPLTTPGVAAQVRAQALHGIQATAMGTEQPTESLGNLATLAKTLHSSVPTVAIPTAAQGGTPLEGQAAALVHKYLGVKYTWGGTTAATGFDCSGLVQTVWKQLGVKVPRTSQEQYKAGKVVTNLQPGDAVFFVGSDGTPSAPGHEGMYIGNGKYIAAPHTGDVVRIFTLADSKDYVGARRFA